MSSSDEFNIVSDNDQAAAVARQKAPNQTTQGFTSDENYLFDDYVVFYIKQQSMPPARRISRKVTVQSP